MDPSDENNTTTAPNDDFRMRLRFRVVKSFYSKGLEESIVVGGGCQPSCRIGAALCGVLVLPVIWPVRSFSRHVLVRI
jgi:hypothetical protein